MKTIDQNNKTSAATQILEGCGVLFFVIMLSSTLLGVTARYLEVAGFEWSFEIAGTAFVWVIFLGAANAEIRQENVAFDALVKQTGPLTRIVLTGIKCIAIVFTGLMLLFSISAALHQSGAVPTPVLRWPSATISAPIAVFSVIACAIGAYRLLNRPRALRCFDIAEDSTRT